MMLMMMIVMNDDDDMMMMNDDDVLDDMIMIDVCICRPAGGSQRGGPPVHYLYIWHLVWYVCM